MISFLSSLFFFVIAIGVLITVHEFGHFWVARRLGVKVLRFSIGFGKPLWTWRRKHDDTEYAIAALPLGGYVRMLDEREGPVAEHELHQAFNRKPVGHRFAIVAAGPLFNFLFAIIAYWLIFMMGSSGMKPMIGPVEALSVAEQGGFRSGDVITSIDGKQTPTWHSVLLTLLEKSLDRQVVEIEVRDTDQIPRRRTLDFRGLDVVSNRADLLDSVGFQPYRPRIPPVIGALEGGGAAVAAGLRPGDRIVAADGQVIEDWAAWVAYVRERPEQRIHTTVDRGGETLAVTLRPARIKGPNGDFGRIGASVEIPEGIADDLRVVVRYSPWAGIGAAFAKTWDMMVLTLRMLAKMVVGEVSVTNLSGPISIAQYAGYSASAGTVPFIDFLALISLSLGVLNFMPVPVLDGGHLLYYLIEILKGKPLSEEAQLLGQRVGVVLLASLMILAFYNDLVRLFS